MSKFSKSNQKLPQKLVEQLKEGEDDRNFRGPSYHRLFQRKEKRKQQRKAKKLEINQFHQKRHGQVVKNPVKPIKKPPMPFKSKTTEPIKKDSNKQQRQIEKFAKENPDLYAKLKQDGLIQGGPEAKTRGLTEDQKDALDIKRYQKLLKIKDPKKLPVTFKSDGLTDLLEGGLLGVNVKGADEPLGESDADDVTDVSDAGDINGLMDELEDALDNFGAGDSDEEKGSDDMMVDGESDELESDDLESGDESQEVEEESEEESAGESGEESEEESREESGEESHESGQDSDNQESKQPEEDIYGRPKNKYIPPHLRNLPKDQHKSEEYLRLKRSIQGQLNRLTDANMESIFGIIDQTYSTNPRHNVTEIITEGILDYISNQANLLDNFVLTYAAFVSLLHSVYGVDVSAYFVEHLVVSLDKAHQQVEQESDTPSKQCTNLVTMLAFLYNFKVVSCIIIYDFIRLFLQGFTELDVELLLRVLKISGHYLRHDDPTALKDIISMVQEKTKGKTLPPRHAFMVEALTDLKNNKRRDHHLTQDQDRLKKFVANVVKKKSSSESEPLRFGLADVRDSGNKGKWWLVGSAWAGHEDSSNVKKEFRQEVTFTDSKLLQLAKKMNMNTDIRRNIFLTIMSAEDYVDAFEKLMKLGLKDKQDREIVRVLIHCTAHEKVYNPYYALISQRLCNLNHGYKITFQYALWDEFKTMDEANVQRIVHIAKLYAHLISTNSLSLTILKTVSLPDLNSKHILFLRVFFYEILVYPKENVERFLHTVFGKLPKQEEFEMLKDTIQIFLQKYLSKGDTGDVIPEGQHALVRTRIKQIKDMFKISF